MEQTQSRPEISEGDRLQALGKSITLVDGRVVNLRYGAKAIRYLEKQYGSIKAFQSEAQKGADGAAATAVFDALIAGLLHLRLGTPDEVEDLLDETKLTTEYVDAFRGAWEESQPPEEQRPSTGDVVPMKTTMGAFPGPTSTTSSPSSSEEPTVNSGI